MSHEEIAVFLASLKRLRDDLDSFNCQVVTLHSAGLRLAALCEEIESAAPASVGTLAQGLISVATSLRSFSAGLSAFRRALLAGRSQEDIR